MNHAMLFKVPGPPLVVAFVCVVAFVLLVVFVLPRVLRAVREHRLASARDRKRIARHRRGEMEETFAPLGEGEARGGRFREKVPRE